MSIDEDWCMISIDECSRRRTVKYGYWTQLEDLIQTLGLSFGVTLQRTTR